MKTLVWSPTFVRAFKRVVHRQPELEDGLRAVVEEEYNQDFCRQEGEE